jgi:hypothetical protein
VQVAALVLGVQKLHGLGLSEAAAAARIVLQNEIHEGLALLRTGLYGLRQVFLQVLSGQASL